MEIQCWKTIKLTTFVSNLSTTLYKSFYQKWPSFVEDYDKNIVAYFFNMVYAYSQFITNILQKHLESCYIRLLLTLRSLMKSENNEAEAKAEASVRPKKADRGRGQSLQTPVRPRQKSARPRSV